MPVFLSDSILLCGRSNRRKDFEANPNDTNERPHLGKENKIGS